MRSADTSPRDQSLGFWELCTALGDGAAASESGTANALDGQIHLALTGVSGEMRASFVTHAPLTGRVAVSVRGKNTTVLAITAHYTVPKRAWEPTGNGGYIHTAVLTGLPPATAVVYR